MKKAEQGQKTRRELLRMGANLFALHGYHHTSTTEILAAVSISKGAFYHHFASKEDFALAILTQVQQDYAEVVVGPIQALPPEERFGAAMEKVVELNTSPQWCNSRLLARLTQDVGAKESNLSRKVSETIELLMQFMTKCVAEAIKGGKVKKELDPYAVAQMVLVTIFGAMCLKSLEESPADITSVIAHLESLVAVPV